MKNDALSQQNEKLNITKLVMYDGRILGFSTLLTDTILLKNIKNEKLQFKIKEKLKINKKYKEISAVKIGRLAIRKEYIGKGLGSHILKHHEKFKGHLRKQNRFPIYNYRRLCKSI